MDRITIPNSVTELGLNVFWDVDIVEITLPFIGSARGNNTPNANGHLHGFSKTSLGWIFGTTSPKNPNYVVEVTSASDYTSHSETGSYRIQYNYNTYYGSNEPKNISNNSYMI